MAHCIALEDGRALLCRNRWIRSTVVGAALGEEPAPDRSTRSATASIGSVADDAEAVYPGAPDIARRASTHQGCNLMTLPASLASKLRLPVVCSPLFIISNPDLVIAQCKAGVVGSFPSLNARPVSLLDEWLHRIREELAAWDRDHPDTPAAPFAVNQIVHKTNDRLDQDLALCAKHEVPFVITSLGAREDLNRAVHGWGGLVFHDVIDDRFARKAIEKGADGLIAVASGAGGHAGRLSPFALVQELRRWFDGPLALSGAIANGRAVLAAQAMGADLAYIGSLFIASQEANAADGYKRMIVDSQASDIVYSNLFTGVHGNYLRPSIVAAGLDPDALPESDASRMSFGSGGSAKAWRDIWGCGQGIGDVDAITPAAEQVARLAREYAAAKASLDGRFHPQPAGAEAVVLAGERLRSHAEIRDRAARAAQAFRETGVGEGDCVALLLRNDFAFFEASLGAQLAGAYPVPLNWHATADEAGYILRDCAAKVLVAHADLLPGIEAGIPEGLAILRVETPAEILSAYRAKPGPPRPAGVPGWDGWIARHPPMATPAAAARAAVIYTSGTTGRPKGVRRAPGTNAAGNPVTLAGWGLGDGAPKTVLMNGPMYHSAPNTYGLASLADGARIVLQPRFEAEGMLALIERHRISHMHIVPTMFFRLLQLPDPVKARYDVSSLRFVVHGAAPCPVAAKRAMIEWWGPVIHEYYGSTETGLATGLDPADALRKPGTVGRALPGVSLRIVDERGRDQPAGVAGDVFVRSAVASGFGYLGLDGQRAAISLGDFVTVGDIGFLDEEGFLFLCDRRRDTIISGGVNIYPAEIEAGLLALDGVAQCAVFGIPDAEFGEAVCAYVVPREGAALRPESIRSGLSGRLSRFKIPKRIEIVAELPVEDSGKVFKRKLRDPYWAASASGSGCSLL